MIEVQINADSLTTEPVGFGIEVINNQGHKIQTAIILQPIKKQN